MATGELLGQEMPATEQIPAPHDNVVAMTRHLFNGAATIRRESDPEIPADYFVVSVKVGGEVDEIVELNRRWHAALGEVAGILADQYRLAFEMA